LPAPLALTVERSVFHAGVQVSRLVLGHTARPPKPNERVLHHVFGISAIRNPLESEQDQGWTVLFDPTRPGLLAVVHRPAPVTAKRCL
jgi:hypothetical protein